MCGNGAVTIVTVTASVKSIKMQKPFSVCFIHPVEHDSHAITFDVKLNKVESVGCECKFIIAAIKLEALVRYHSNHHHRHHR